MPVGPYNVVLPGVDERTEREVKESRLNVYQVYLPGVYHSSIKKGSFDTALFSPSIIAQVYLHKNEPGHQHYNKL